MDDKKDELTYHAAVLWYKAPVSTIVISKFDCSRVSVYSFCAINFPKYVDAGERAYAESGGGRPRSQSAARIIVYPRSDITKLHVL